METGPMTKDEKLRLFTILDDQTEDLKALQLSVKGNKEAGFPGLLTDVAIIKDYIEKDKAMKSKMVGAFIVIGFLWTGVWEVLKSWVAKMFHQQP